MPPDLTVVGSINLDLVARVKRFPRAGETVSGATLERIPGGKGANQAVAAARLGAHVRMIGAVGRDFAAEEALASLREAGVELDVRELDSPTGIAIILVDAAGENQIVVVPGANAELRLATDNGWRAALCQLEIPDAAIERRGRPPSGFASMPHRHARSQCRQTSSLRTPTSSR